MNEPIAENPALRAELESVIDEQRDAFYASGWWHSIDLGQGRITPGVHQLTELQRNYREFNLPDDLSGQRLLDVGCWDGFYSFEAERHGAQVTSVDVWRPQTYFQAHTALRSQAIFHEKSVYELKREELGGFDVVLFLGVLYHLKHPLLALERICELTNEYAIIETHAVDNLFETSRPVMEFYEVDQLGGQYDNWWGPNSECVMQMARAAGFVRTEALRIDPTRAVVKAYRSWLPWENLEEIPSLRIRRVINACTDDQRYPRAGRHAYLAVMVEGLPEGVKRESFEFDIGGWGSPAVYLGPSKFAEDAGALQVTVPIPSGLPIGVVSLQMRCGNQRATSWDLSLSEGQEW